MAKKEMDIRAVKKSVVELINDDWALATAGTAEKWNTMTVSWGGVGELWNHDVAFLFIRPQRYTYEFVEHEAHFTLSFFDGGMKKEMGICGAKSGRDIDKSAATGLTAAYWNGVPYIEQAKLVLVCRKLAFQDIDPAGFLDPEIDTRCYPQHDYHRMYVGAIEAVLCEE